MKTPDVRDNQKGVSRRAVLAAVGFAPAAGVLLHTPSALADVPTSAYTSPSSGASVQYPTAWNCRASAGTMLRYPNDSFAVTSAGPPDKAIEDLPDLSSYSQQDVFLWLIHYDDLQPARDCPPFQQIDSFSDLTQRVSEYSGFARYGEDFSGSQRSFILRLWIGTAASSRTISLLNGCLQSIRIP